MAKNNEDVPVNVSKTRARGGVTGHNVRYVLAFGLAGVIIAFVALGLYYGWGAKPNPPPQISPADSQESPATGQ
jgi:hypothetical protein